MVRRHAVNILAITFVPRQFYQATLAISPVRASLRPEDSAMAAFKSAASVEEQLRHVTQIKRIRVSEFFKDFDPLRSGYITSKMKFKHQNLICSMSCALCHKAWHSIKLTVTIRISDLAIIDACTTEAFCR